jgi:hypothetical protein
MRARARSRAVLNRAERVPGAFVALLPVIGVAMIISGAFDPTSAWPLSPTIWAIAFGGGLAVVVIGLLLTPGDAKQARTARVSIAGSRLAERYRRPEPPTGRVATQPRSSSRSWFEYRRRLGFAGATDRSSRPAP